MDLLFEQFDNCESEKLSRVVHFSESKLYDHTFLLIINAGVKCVSFPHSVAAVPLRIVLPYMSSTSALVFCITSLAANCFFSLTLASGTRTFSS